MVGPRLHAHVKLAKLLFICIYSSWSHSCKIIGTLQVEMWTPLNLQTKLADQILSPSYTNFFRINYTQLWLIYFYIIICSTPFLWWANFSISICSSNILLTQWPLWYSGYVPQAHLCSGILETRPWALWLCFCQYRSCCARYAWPWCCLCLLILFVYVLWQILSMCTSALVLLSKWWS